MSVGIIDKAVNWLVNLANDNSHGYDQQYRWGEHGDYDCSSSTITAFEQAGLKVKENGATYTGNMRVAFEKCGFKSRKYASDIIPRKGDVFLNEKHHVVVAISDKQVVTASINEKGKTMGGQAGDQTGKEIYIRDFYVPSYGWDYVLRYEEPVISNPYTMPTQLLKKGMVGDEVRWIQYELREAGADIEIDAHFGSLTEQALRDFQRAVGIECDGICGSISRAKLIENMTPILHAKKNPYKHSQITLKKGSRGISVRWLQWELNYRINAGLQEDGSFGKLTERKVIEFQKMVGLTADGIVGSRTWKALES